MTLLQIIWEPLRFFLAVAMVAYFCNGGTLVLWMLDKRAE